MILFQTYGKRLQSGIWLSPKEGFVLSSDFNGNFLVLGEMDIFQQELYTSSVNQRSCPFRIFFLLYSEFWKPLNSESISLPFFKWTQYRPFPVNPESFSTHWSSEICALCSWRAAVRIKRIFCKSFSCMQIQVWICCRRPSMMKGHKICFVV